MPPSREAVEMHAGSGALTQQATRPLICLTAFGRVSSSPPPKAALAVLRVGAWAITASRTVTGQSRSGVLSCREIVSPTSRDTNSAT